MTLPRGVIGNPEATPKCDPVDFVELAASLSSTRCPANTQIGYLDIPIAESTRKYAQGDFSIIDGVLNRVAIYNLEPPYGVPADLAFNTPSCRLTSTRSSIPARTTRSRRSPRTSQTRLRSAAVKSPSGEFPVTRRTTSSAPSPKSSRKDIVLGAPFGGAEIRPFLTTPTDCGFDNGGARIRADSYNHPGKFSPIQEYCDPLNVTGCDDPRFRFEPEISLQPTSRDAGGPTGLDVHLEVPQRND